MRAWAKAGRLAVFGWLLAGSAGAASAATITAVTPQGEVAQVRQIAVTFSNPVVAFGDPRLPDPLAVRCEGGASEGSGRWASDRRWLYDFREALPPGTQCSLSARAEWAPSKGTLTGKTDFSFSTGGPAVVQVQPHDGARITEDQFFLLRLNGPALPSTVLAGAWCEVEGIGERIGVRIVEGDARGEVLKARHIEGERAEQTLVVACTRPLPSGAPMRLIWGKGIAADVNPKLVTSIQQVFRYEVREAFNAEFSCERERADAPCVPVRPMTVRFSAPIARDAAEKVRLKPADGGAPIAPSFDKDDHATSVREVQFAPPFAERAKFSIELPADLPDDAGRPLSNAALFPLTVATDAAPPIAKFATAPFGIVEASDPVLPVTLRHVQGDLRPGAATGQVRVKQPKTDAEILVWYSRLARWHESQLSAKELGLPQSEWFSIEDDTDTKGKPIQRRRERYVDTREVPLLSKEPDAKRLDLPQLDGGDPRPFEVIGIPLSAPGYHVVEIESLRLGQALLDKRAPMYVRTGVLVTNLGVHFKLGRESSVVWVTTLDRAQPQADAQVNVNDCRGKPLWTGTTDEQGIARIDRALDANFQNCAYEDGLFVTARKADGDGVQDVAFVFSNWQKGIEPWRFNVSSGSDAETDVRAATVFDRTLLRAGETVSMKHFARRETQQGLANLAPADLPTQLRIVHRGSGQEFTQPLEWNGVRSAASTWAIPKAAKLGVYDVALVRENADPKRRGAWDSGNFRVEEFRVPLVDARVQGPKGTVVAPAEIPVSVQLNYLSGGAMARVPARASAVLKDRTVAFDGFEDFSFEPPRAAKARRPGGDEEEETEGESQSGTDDSKLIADKLPITTDSNGAASFTLKDLPPITRASRIEAEVTFNDPNGEVATVSTTIPVWPGSVVLGMKTAGWASRGKVDLTTVALDTGGQPIAGQAIDVRARLSRVISTRKRMVGGFYAYDNRTEIKDLGPVCSGKSDARGRLVCQANLTSAGQIELIASTADSAGHAVRAASQAWVSAHGELWFAQDNDDRIDVLPEKKSYEPGETAKLQVRMPFREATALISVEREGVIETRVVKLRGDDPNIELKIEPTWGPNVYVSVLALRGRIREVPWYSFFTWGWKEPREWIRTFADNVKEGSLYRAPTAMVDLAKPSFKLGVAQLKVGIGAHRLEVAVSADKAVYQVREKATVRVKVAFDGKPATHASVAFAAVDEGLLALRDNQSWDLLHSMIRERAWGVATATAQSEIIGRRHYGRKAVAAGGGGGHGGTRELFDTLLLWRADVALDANGEAVLEVPLNDSLTSFRLVAVADDGVARFGTGSASIRVTQDLQMLSGLPPLVRSGDEFSALLTLRNTTKREMKVRATLAGTVGTVAAAGTAGTTGSAGKAGTEGTAGTVTEAAGTAGTTAGSAGLGGATALAELPTKEVVLAPDTATELAWDVHVPALAAADIVWEAAVEEIGAPTSQTPGAPAPKPARDRVKITQKVVPAVPERVLQATLLQLDGAFTMPVASPADALPAEGPKRGGIVVAAQPKLSGALPGIRRYFETYPFTCLEPLTSVAIGLGDMTRWERIANQLSTYLDSDGLASYFPPRAGDGAHGSDTLTAYLLAATHDAGVELPRAAREAMIRGLRAFVDGRIERRIWTPQAASGTERAVRKLAAIAALARYDEAAPRMLGSIELTPNVWPTGALIDWLRILKSVKGILNQNQRLAEANQILKNRLTYSGTTLKFSTEATDFWWWLMDSADANAARLILAVLDDPDWKDDLPQMVGGSLGRQRRGAWLTTTANLWGAVALRKFSAQFESQPVTGGTLATLGAGTQVIDWDAKPEGGKLTLGWPARPATLDVVHVGSGKPWLTVQSLAAIPLTAPLASGYRITRKVSAVEQKTPGQWSRGDVLRVRLDVDAQADMTWVVVSDPVPGGATILGSGLGRDSAIAVASGVSSDSRGNAWPAWPAYEERGFEVYRGYFEFLPRGKHVVEYTLRLNNPGTFALPPTRVEALYAPESFGEAPNAPIQVGP